LATAFNSISPAPGFAVFLPPRISHDVSGTSIFAGRIPVRPPHEGTVFEKPPPVYEEFS